MLLALSVLAESVPNTSHQGRSLLQQPIKLAQTEMQLHVWLDSRQAFQQQLIPIRVELMAEEFTTEPQLLLTSESDSAWTAPIYHSQAVHRQQDGQAVRQWTLWLAAQQAGVLSLPTMRLQVVGRAMAKQTISLPKLSLRIAPLPFFLPTETLLAERVQLDTQVSQLGWFQLVGEQLQQQTLAIFDQLQAHQFWLSGVQGKGIQGLSADINEVDTQWLAEGQQRHYQVIQPWQITQAGFWQVDAQDIWLFNGRTWQLTHVQIPAISGFAIPVWLWHVVQALLLFISLWLAYVIWRYAACVWRNQRYRRQILQADGVQSLYQAIYLGWSLHPDVPLAHQSQSLPIAAQALAVERLYYEQRMQHRHVEQLEWRELQQALAVIAPISCRWKLTPWSVKV